MVQVARCPSPLQKRILIVLAALDAKRPGPVATRDIERVLEQSGEAPVYGPNLRASCRRMEAAGWLRTLRAPNLRLAVELTARGRELALPQLRDEQERKLAEQRATDVVVLPLVRVKPVYESDTFGDDRPVKLGEHWRMACRGDYVIRLDGTTCLQLWSASGKVARLEGDSLQVATWLQACHDAGIDIRLQINESTTPAQGDCEVAGGEFPGGQTISTTVVWYQEVLRTLRQHNINGLSATNHDHLKMVKPDRRNRDKPLQERFLALADGMRGRTEALKAVRDEDTTRGPLCEALTALGFSPAQVARLMRIIDWPVVETEAQQREALADLLRELAARGIDGDREKLMTLIFSPVRRPEETWRGRLQWLLGGELAAEFRFCSQLTREQAGPALDWLADTLGQHGVSHFARAVRWADGTALPD